MAKIVRFDDLIDDETIVLTFRYVSKKDNEEWATVFNKINKAAKKSAKIKITDMEYLGENEYAGYVTINIEEYENIENKANKNEITIEI